MEKLHVGHLHTTPSGFLFDSAEEGAEGELSAAAVICTQSGLFRGRCFLDADGLLSFSILNETSRHERYKWNLLLEQ